MRGTSIGAASLFLNDLQCTFLTLGVVPRRQAKRRRMMEQGGGPPREFQVRGVHSSLFPMLAYVYSVHSTRLTANKVRQHAHHCFTDCGHDNSLTAGIVFCTQRFRDGPPGDMPPMGMHPMMGRGGMGGPWPGGPGGGPGMGWRGEFFLQIPVFSSWAVSSSFLAHFPPYYCNVTVADVCVMS